MEGVVAPLRRMKRGWSFLNRTGSLENLHNSTDISTSSSTMADVKLPCQSMAGVVEAQTSSILLLLYHSELRVEKCFETQDRRWSFLCLFCLSYNPHLLQGSSLSRGNGLKTVLWMKIVVHFQLWSAVATKRLPVPTQSLQWRLYSFSTRVKKEQTDRRASRNYYMNALEARTRKSMASSTHSLATISSSAIFSAHWLERRNPLPFFKILGTRLCLSVTFRTHKGCLYVDPHIPWGKSDHIVVSQCSLSLISWMASHPPPQMYGSSFTSLSLLRWKKYTWLTREEPTFTTSLGFIAFQEINSLLSSTVTKCTSRRFRAQIWSDSADS